MTKEKLAEASNQSDVIRQDNKRLNEWAKQVDERAIMISETRFTERSQRHMIYELLWANHTPNLEFNDAMRKYTELKFERDLKLVSESRPYSRLPDYQILDSKNAGKRLDAKTDYFFLPTEVIRKILEIDSNSNSNSQQSDSSTDLQLSKINLGPNSMTKYLCAHKHVNPLAINRLKVVSRRGLDLLKSKSGIEWETFALPAYSQSTTLCWKCVLACFEYLKLREELKNELKKFKVMNQIEYTDGMAAAAAGLEIDTKSIKKKKQHQQNDENDDVLILEDKSSSPPSSRGRLSETQANDTPHRNVSKKDDSKSKAQFS